MTTKGKGNREGTAATAADRDHEEDTSLEDLPLTDIPEDDIRDNDILLGRGGKTNHHPGNARYLKIIGSHQEEYFLIESRTEKTEFAMNLVRRFRAEAIRFLKKNTATDGKDGISATTLWSDVGDIKMREKVSQNLREHQPAIKEKYQNQQKGNTGTNNCRDSTTTGAVPCSPGNSSNNGSISSLPPTNNNFMPSPGGMGSPYMMQPQFCNNNSNSMPISPSQFMRMQWMAQQQNEMYRRSSGGSHNSTNSNNYNNNNIPQQEQQYYRMLAAQQPQQPQNVMSLMSANGMNNTGHHNNNNNNNMPSMSMSTIPGPPLTFPSSDTLVPTAVGGPISDGSGGVPIIQLDGENKNGNDNAIDPLPYNSPEEEEEEEEIIWNNNNNERRLSALSIGDDDNITDNIDDADDDDFGIINTTTTTTTTRNSTAPSLADIDIAAALGASTGSLLDSLHVDAVLECDNEEDEDGDDDHHGKRPTSPKSNTMMMMMNNEDNDPRYTPVSSNRNIIETGYGENPATVTPTPNSPTHSGDIGRKQPQDQSGVLDDDILKAWANSDYDDDELANDPFVMTNEFPSSHDNDGTNNGGRAQTAGFRRHNTSEGHTRASAAQTAPFRRTYTNPGQSGVIGSTMPRKTRTCPGRAQSPPLGEEFSPRPTSLTKEKRATSNVNETPETRRHLAYQQQQGGAAIGVTFDPRDTERSDTSTSSWSSVKKASLGRDKSEQSRMLKQQYMPHAYGSPTGKTDTISSAATGATSWPTNVPLDPQSPTPENTEKNNGDNEITPKTSRLMKDFGKMNLSMAQTNKNNSSSNGNDDSARGAAARTARNFEDTLAANADKMPMNLMVKKPERLMWRNRTSTIDALDLDCLDDDPVLNEERQAGGKGAPRRQSRNSINEVASMWADVPSSGDFDALVSDIAKRRVSELLDQPVLSADKSKSS